MDFAKAFRTLREEAGLSRPEMAAQLCYTQSALSKIERGKVIPKNSSIVALCVLVRVPVARFYLLALEASDFGSIEPIR